MICATVVSIYPLRSFQCAGSLTIRLLVKYARQNSIHFSPTVLWDGVIEGSISSSWGEKEWTEFLEKKVSV